MALITEDDLSNTVRSYAPAEPEVPVEKPQAQEQTTGFIEAGKAFFTLEDPVFNIAKEFIAPEVSHVFDPNFRPIDKLEQERPDLIDYASNFIEVRNEEEFNRKSFNIDYELEQKNILQKASTIPYIAGALAAGVVDPITLIPFVKIVKDANTAARMAKSAAAGMGLGAASGLIREAILQETTETRTMEQSVTNLVVTSVAGAVFGAGIAAFSKPAAYEANKILLAKAIEGEDIQFIVDNFEDSVLGRGAREIAISKEAAKVDALLGPEHLVSSKAVVSLQGNSVIRIALDEQSRLVKELGAEAAAKKLKFTPNEAAEKVDETALNQYRTAVDEELALAEETANIPKNEGPRSAGAMEVNSQEVDMGLAHINERFVKLATGPEELRAPELRAALSKSKTVQKLGDVFYASPLIKKYHAKGISLGDKAESMISRNRRDLVQDSNLILDTFTKYTGKGKILSGMKATRGADKISFREFSRRAWGNLTDSTRIDDIPGINKISSYMRKRMDNRVAELQKAKILEGEIDPEFMRNYMTRAYDQDKLADPRAQEAFVTKVSNWVKVFNKDNTLRLTPLGDDEARAIAEGALSNIRRESDQAIAMSSLMESFISTGKFTKERQLMIPDSEIQEFLIDDAFKLYNNYMERSGRLLAAKESLRKTGYDNINDAIRDIKSDGDKAKIGITDKAELAKIDRYFLKEEALANKMYRSVLGQLKKPGSSSRLTSRLLDYNYARLLGGVTISSLSEVMMPVFRFGVWNTVRHGWYPMVRSLATSKLTKSQLDDSIGALEMKQNTILRLLEGTEDPDSVLREATRMDVAFKVGTAILTKATFIGDWTAFGSGIAGQVSSARLTRLIRKTNKSPEDVELLASIGVDKNMYSRIESQVKTHTQKLKGSYVINPHLWNDTEALNVFKSAVNTDVEATILKSGIGTQPLWVQESGLGKVLFQFNTFMNAATSRILISGLQRHDKDVVMGVIGLVHMGGLIQLLRHKYQERDVEMDYKDFIMAGLSNSGILGLIGTKGLDTYRTASDPNKARFLDSTIEGMIMGPTAGLISQVTKTLQKLTDDEVTNKDIKAGIRLAPYTNLPPIIMLFNKIFPNEE
jgi:hypothetical protein